MFVRISKISMVYRGEPQYNVMTDDDDDDATHELSACDEYGT